MNADRRKKIDLLISTVEQLKADIEILRDEEQEYHDNMPESFQSGAKGDSAQTAIDALEEACNACDEITSGLENARDV